MDTGPFMPCLFNRCTVGSFAGAGWVDLVLLPAAVGLGAAEEPTGEGAEDGDRPVRVVIDVAGSGEPPGLGVAVADVDAEAGPAFWADIPTTLAGGTRCAMTCWRRPPPPRGRPLPLVGVGVGC
jgi:hypothetical protein